MSTERDTNPKPATEAIRVPNFGQALMQKLIDCQKVIAGHFLRGRVRASYKMNADKWIFLSDAQLEPTAAAAR
jgi:hypothetical protein